MTKKQELDRLIDEMAPEAILAAARDPDRSSRLVRRILGRLYAGDPAVKWRAVAALGVVIEAGVFDEQRILELVKRFTWALNDESGAVPFGVPEALGEVLAHRHDLRSLYAPLLVSYVVHDDLVQTGPILGGAIWALGRVGFTEEGEGERIAPGLEAALDEREPFVRGATLWALPRLGLADDLRERVEGRLDDDEAVVLLEAGAVRHTTVGDLAREALGALGQGGTLAP